MPVIGKERDWWTTPLFSALEVAMAFGQEPVEFTRRFERMGRGMQAQLTEFVRLKSEMEMR